MEKQLKSIGLSLDWSREFATCDPSCYKHQQKLFLDFLKAGLAEREQRKLNWDPVDMTVLANEQVIDGRGWRDRLDFEWLKALQTGSELALLMIEVDHFKLYNDTYGHPEGDVCLSRLGEALAAIADETGGFAGRYGGEEFCLLLPNFSAPRARSPPAKPSAPPCRT